ncbi:MAG: LysR family transcriptional regulator [Comamonadaceae bacterium]|nr:LysR family transcriptional regulator [Comamonadaceae bacterium]
MAYESINASVTLRQLQTLVNVAELGSFVAASRTMHVTPSALSILISELEQTLGFRVFDRTTRQLQLSAAGKQYLPYAQRVLLELEGAQRCAQEVRSQKTGIVRIATSQVIAWTLMPPALRAFRTLRPGVRLEPIDLPVDEILPNLEAGRVDLAVTLQMLTGPELHASPAFHSQVHVACHEDHPWAKRKALRWNELSSEPLIFTGIDTPQRINAALPDGPRLEAARQVEHMGTGLALVASGFGSAICAGYVRPMCDMHQLRMIPLVKPEVLRQFAIYSSSKRSLTPVAEGFHSFLLEWFRKAGNTPLS